MVKKSEQNITETQVSQFVQDFITLQLHMSEIPLEMTRVRNVVDEMRLKRTYKRNNVHVLIHRMMDLMYPNNKPTMGELSRAIELPLSTTTNVIGFLVKNGYCKRLSDRGDRRIVRVSLTDAGRKNLEMGNKYISQRGQEILSALATNEQATFLALLNKISKNIINNNTAV